MFKPCLPALLAAAAQAPALVASGCSPDEGTTTSYVVVSEAARQPESTDRGTYVVLEQKGGVFLHIKTEAGTHTLPTDPADAAGRTVSCVPAPQGLFFFKVTPADVECDLSVELLGKPADDSADCTGARIDGKLLPITTRRSNATSPGTGGAGGEGGGGPGGGGSGGEGGGGPGGGGSGGEGGTDGGGGGDAGGAGGG